MTEENALLASLAASHQRVLATILRDSRPQLSSPSHETPHAQAVSARRSMHARSCAWIVGSTQTQTRMVNRRTYISRRRSRPGLARPAELGLAACPLRTDGLPT